MSSFIVFSKYILIERQWVESPVAMPAFHARVLVQVQVTPLLDIMTWKGRGGWSRCLGPCPQVDGQGGVTAPSFHLPRPGHSNCLESEARQGRLLSTFFPPSSCLSLARGLPNKLIFLKILTLSPKIYHRVSSN